MSSKNGSTNCSHCKELEDIIHIQKEKLSTVELRLRDCVRAYKTVLHEKNIILQNLEASKELSTKRADEDEIRLAQLESNLTELSSICGKYEAENIKNQGLISELNLKCDELAEKLAVYESHTQNDDDQLDAKENKNINSSIIPIVNHKWTQTSMEIKSIDKEEKRSKPKLATQNQETQTTTELPTIKQRKAECAIVIPTHRDIDSEKAQSDSRRGSHASRESGSETVFADTDLNTVDADNRFDNNRPSLGSVSTVNQDIGNNSVSLFYVNELARKEIELAETRLAARENECALRELKWKYNVDTFKLQSKVTQMEQQLKQLQTDDTTKPNLTYIRNVLVRFLKTKDKNQKNCMMNALLTALGIDPKEMKK